MTEVSVLSGGLKGDVERRPPERFERTVARRSAEIRATVPDVELTATVEVSAAEALALQLGVSLDALVLAAAAAALRAVPRLNGAYRDGAYETYSRVNVGVVCATQTSYAIPTVFDADRKTTAELTAELTDYAGRASRGELSPADLTGATFTLSLAPGPVVSAHSPLIIGPQAAALAVGAVRDEPVVRDGTVAPGNVITVTLACDHRIGFGPHAAAFLGHLTDHLRRAR